MKKLLSILLCACMLLCMLPLSAAAADRAQEMLDAMTTEQKITQMLMPVFRYFPDETGATQGVTEIFPEMREMLARYSFGGVILFAQNTVENAQTLRLTDAIQQANAVVAGRPQLLISTDQEGGNVTRLGEGTQMPGNMALGAAGDTALTAQAATIIGEELMALGINMDAAPVLDVNSNPANPVIGIRSFSDDPQTVAKHGVSFMQALQQTNTVFTLKHFPGHGDTDTDSHTGLPCVNKTYDELRGNELVPFQAAIDAGAEVIMTAHIQYPQIEKATYKSISTGEEIYLPATLSKTILTDVLRDDMGFDGVVITDAMNMAAIQTHFDPLDAAQLAIAAGVDIILMPVDVSTEAGMQALEQYIADLTALTENGTISIQQVNTAVLRILRLKEAHGLLDAYDASGLDTKLTAAAQVGSKAHHEIEWSITKKAVTLLKNDHNMLPLTGKGEKTVALTAYDNEVLSMEYAVNRLKDEGKLSGNVSVYSIQNKSLEEILPLIQDADHVVIISEQYRAANLNPNDASGAYSAKVDGVIEQVHQKGGDVAILSCYLPYDAARYSDADAIMVAWSAKGMSEDPRTADGAIKQYGPNIPAAFYLMLTSDEAPTGTLPVNIPALTKDYQYSDQILYARGYGITYQRTEDFTDVDWTAWYADGIRYVTERGIMIGVGDGKFQPNGIVTRAQVVTTLWRIAGAPEVEDGVPAFTDIAVGGWYDAAVRWAAKNQITKGTSATTFSPDDPVTREQFVTLLYRFAAAENGAGEMGLAGYQDAAQVSDWAYTAMTWAIRSNIIQGVGNATLAPKDTLTRGQLATILMRYQQTETS